MNRPAVALAQEIEIGADRPAVRADASIINEAAANDRGDRASITVVDRASFSDLSATLRDLFSSRRTSWNQTCSPLVE